VFNLGDETSDAPGPFEGGRWVPLLTTGDRKFGGGRAEALAPLDGRARIALAPHEAVVYRMESSR
jgi:hypothetical protein